MFKNDKNIMSGKGENDKIKWITVNGSHIPIEGGETPKQAIKNHFEDKEKTGVKHNPAKVQEVAKLIDALKNVRKIKTKELFNVIKNFDPVELKTDDERFMAEFDRFCANKNIYEKGNSDKIGFNYKVSNVEKLPSIIKESNYSHTTKEIGKNSPQHKGVKKWHYFENVIETDLGKFKVVVNVRDKGDKKRVYEVAFNKIKEKT